MTLAEILKAEKPVIIDFYSADCPPCLLMTEILNKVQDQLENKCEIFTIDQTVHPEAFEIFNVKTLPHLKLFKKGKPVWSGSGLFNEDELKQLIKKNLSNDKIKSANK